MHCVMGRLSILSILLCLGLLTELSNGKSETGSQVAMTTASFVYQLTRDMFFNESSSGGDGIMLTPSVISYPDLPAWLKFIQRDLQMGGFLYGTPQTIDDAVQIEIVAVNKNTMETTYRLMNIEVEDKPDRASYFVELQIVNFNIEELLLEANQNYLLGQMQDLWPEGGDVYMTKVMSLKDLGQRLPVPEKPGDTLLKEGVLVQFGGMGDFSTELKAAQAEVQGNSCGGSPAEEPSVTIDSEFSPKYIVDWCKFKLIGVI